MIKKITIYTVVVSILVSVILFSYKTYKDYETVIIEQQQEHLMTICKSTTRSLEIYFDGVSDILEGVANKLSIAYQDQKNIKYENILQELVSINIPNNDFSFFYFFDENGNLEHEVTLFSKLKFDVNQLNTADNENIHFEVIKELSSEEFFIHISVPVKEGFKIHGYISTFIPMNTIYHKIVQPIKAGKFGYARIKDMNGIILMHPEKDQIGLHVIEERKRLYPNLNLTELDRLVKRQLAGEEGTAIYNSYWWIEDEYKLEKKVSAFTPFYYNDLAWVVSVPMSYTEISEPIKSYLLTIINIAGITLLVLIIVLYIILKLKNEKNKAQMEMKYLKELRKRDVELQHDRRLKTLGTLASGISHEFDNLLTPILGFGYLLLDKMDKNEEDYKKVETICDSAEKAGEIIDKILVFSRKGKVESQYNWIEINNFIDNAYKLITNTIPNTIDIELNKNTVKGDIWGNETELMEVLVNLCKNAYQAINAPDGYITINVSYSESNKKMIVISIEDNGKGMDEKTMEHIFDPFFTTRAAGEGTGLGLSLVYGIVTEHGGAINVSSKENEGTTFYLYLPVHNDDI